MTPQAMRLPELPAGSVFMSSAFSWTTMEVPPLAMMLFGGGGVEGEVVDLEGGLADVAFADHDVLGKSPAWWPMGF